MNETGYMSKWTVMVYFAADNDLDDAAFENLRQMKQAGSNSKCNFLAQVDTRGIGKTIKFRIRDQRTTLDEDVLGIEDEINTGLGSELTKFLNWGMKLCPAEHYMLIIWGHGEGWQSANDAHRAAARTTDAIVHVNGDCSMGVSAKGELRLFVQRQQNGDSTPAQISISPEIISALTDLLKKETGQGDPRLGQFAARLGQIGVKLNKDRRPQIDSQDMLTNEELKKSLRNTLKEYPGVRLDILGMDACLMGMAETAYEVRKSVEYFVASEDAVPRNSWPYDKILSRLAKRPEMTPKEVALMIIREYLINYRDNAKGVTLSACHLSHKAHHALKDAVKELAQTLKDKLDDDKVRLAVMTARAVAQSFYLREFVDLYDLCKQLDRFCTDPVVKEKCRNVMTAIFPDQPNQSEAAKSFSEDTFVWTYGHCGYPVKDAKGVSIYFPVDRLLSAEYNKLEFVTKTGWGKFLESYMRKLDLPASSLAGKPAAAALGGAPVKADGECTGTSKLKTICGTEEKIPLGSLTELPGKQQNSPQFECEQEKKYAETCA
jgi:hypothetical protein